MRTIEACCFAEAGAVCGLKAVACGKRGGGVVGDAVCASAPPIPPVAIHSTATASQQ